MNFLKFGEAFMKKKRLTALVLLLCILLSVWCCPILAEQTAEAEPETEAETESSSGGIHVEAKAAMLIDLKTGRSIYELNADQRIYPASLTKIMTCLVALENGNLSDMVTVSESALAPLDSDSSVAGLQVGETMTLENMLYCMMVVSGNDACNVIAEHIAGSTGGFVRMMNEKAYELGCRDTNFCNVHGLHEDDHYTTARDLSIITKAALKSENFRVICDTDEYELPATNLSEERLLESTNMLIFKSSNNSFYYPYAKGIKTGYTGKAGRCVISMAEKNGVELLAIVCGAETTFDENGGITMQNFPQCINLFNYGFDNFSYVTPLSTLYPVAQVTVTHSAGSESVAVSPESDVRALLPNGYKPDDLVIETSLNAEEVEAPVKKGDVMGTVTASYAGEELATVNLVAIADVAKSEVEAAAVETGAYIQSNWWKWLVAIIFISILAFICFAVIMKNKRRREKRRLLEQRRRAAERRWQEEE